MNRAKAIADLAYSALAIAVLAYTVRGEIRRIVTEKRAEIEAHRAALIERDRARNARRGFVRFLRENGIEPTADEIEVAANA